MRPNLPLFAVAVAFLTVTTVRADDAAVDQLRAAQAALANAKAWRRTTITTHPDTSTSQTVVAEAVQPELFHYVTWSGDEYFSDGKRDLLRNRDGTVRAADPENLKPLNYAREKYSLKRMLEGLKDAHVETHETLRDLPATVVAFTIEGDGVVSTGKLWISDADHLPLKIESETRNQRNDVPFGIRVNQHATGTYEYGPSIQIVMP